MFPPSTSDIELINKVKEDRDSEAISELVNRHSGAYLQVVNKYCSLSSGKLSFQDLSEDRTFNIYKYAQTYNPDKQTKFSTYVCNMARYTCLDLLKQEPSIKEPLAYEGSESIIQEIIPSTETTNENLDELDMIRAIDTVIKGKKYEKNFKKILKLRHPKFTDNVLTWQEIGEKLGMTYEGARKIYGKGIQEIKKYLSK